MGGHDVIAALLAVFLAAGVGIWIAMNSAKNETGRKAKERVEVWGKGGWLSGLVAEADAFWVGCEPVCL